MNEQDKDPKVSPEDATTDTSVEQEVRDDSQASDTDTHAKAAENRDTELEQDGNEDSPELVAAKEEITKLKDAYLRAKAEEDNVRRRTEKEVVTSRKFAVEGFAKEMLQVRDSLKLAVAVELEESADESIKSVHEGVSITLKQLDAAFGKFSLQEIAPEVGDKLDPNLHQAMSIVESNEVESGCILNVIQAGFQLHDRLLRPAMVVVAK